ncbi:MAG: hypothetical protein U1F58_08505 [Burkholderiales bacterium]
MSRIKASPTGRSRVATLLGMTPRDSQWRPHLAGVAGVKPASSSRLASPVLAPRRQIGAAVFGGLLSRRSVEANIRKRVAAYGGVHDGWSQESLLPHLDRIEVAAIAWEQVLEGLPATDARADLERFHAQCLAFNPLRGENAP